MREFPRYDVSFSVKVEANGRSRFVRVYDLSESGIRIAKMPDRDQTGDIPPSVDTRDPVCHPKEQE